jgi:hypothetical protein
MSLATDSIFMKAIQSDASLMQKIGGRLYGTAIELPDEDLDNVPVPYVIVTFNGLTNDQGTKDDRYESRYDKVEIGVEVTAKTLDDLHVLTEMVRDTILSYLRSRTTAVDDYLFTAEGIQYDSLKPCYWQVLRYQCDTIND